MLNFNFMAAETSLKKLLYLKHSAIQYDQQICTPPAQQNSGAQRGAKVNSNYSINNSIILHNYFYHVTVPDNPPQRRYCIYPERPQPAAGADIQRARVSRRAVLPERTHRATDRGTAGTRQQRRVHRQMRVHHYLIQLSHMCVTSGMTKNQDTSQNNVCSFSIEGTMEVFSQLNIYSHKTVKTYWG